MELLKINGNTSVIMGPTNVGVYAFKSKQCIVVDTGTGVSYGRRIDGILKENGLKPKFIINTHYHEDHTGGNKYFIDNYPGVVVNTSAFSRVFIENPIIAPTVLFSGNPPKPLVHKGLSKEVHESLSEGIVKFNDEKFTILDISGHCVGQIGIITPDRVCFLGDSIFSEDILDKYSFPYLYDIEQSLETLEKIRDIDADYFVISHSKSIIKKEDMSSLVDKNVKNINNYIEQILEILDTPTTREDLLESLMFLNGITMNFKQYYLNFNTLSSFITHLYNKNLIQSSVEDGKVYYYK